MLLGPDGSPVEAALTGVDAAAADTESVAVDAPANGPVDGADTDELSPAGVAAAVAPAPARCR